MDIWKIAPDCRAEKIPAASRDVADLSAYRKARRLFAAPDLTLRDHLWLLKRSDAITRGTLPEGERMRLAVLAQAVGVA